MFSRAMGRLPCLSHLPMMAKVEKSFRRVFHPTFQIFYNLNWEKKKSFPSFSSILCVLIYSIIAYVYLNTNPKRRVEQFSTFSSSSRIILNIIFCMNNFVMFFLGRIFFPFFFPSFSAEWFRRSSFVWHSPTTFAFDCVLPSCLSLRLCCFFFL